MAGLDRTGARGLQIRLQELGVSFRNRAHPSFCTRLREPEVGQRWNDARVGETGREPAGILKGGVVLKDQ